MSECPICFDDYCSCGFLFLDAKAGQLRQLAELLQDVAAFIEEFGPLGYPVEIRHFEKFKKWRIEHHRG